MAKVDWSKLSAQDVKDSLAEMPGVALAWAQNGTKWYRSSVQGLSVLVTLVPERTGKGWVIFYQDGSLESAADVNAAKAAADTYLGSLKWKLF